MTISFSGGTGSPAASAQGSTSISVAYPAFVAAGRIALLYATVKLSTATFNTTISGWEFIGEQEGGTGTSANDAGTTKIAAWYRVLDGTESGSVTVTNTGGVSSAGAMDIYQGTVGGWATPEFVSGADTTHDTSWSVTGGTWSSALAVDDWIILPMSTDTDVAQSITSRALTQTGITFAGNFFRSRSLSTTGTDCGLYTFDWRVTAGSNTNAPTNVHTSGTNNCGAQLFIRLREAAGGTAYSETPTDTEGLTDTSAFDQGKGVTDTEGLTDTRAFDQDKTLPVDAIGLTDAVARDIGQPYIDSFGLTDTVAAVLGREETLSDTLGLTDSLTIDLGKLVQVDDTLGLTDTRALVFDANREPAETVELTDTLTFELQMVLADTAGLTDTAALVVTYARTITDTLGLTDERTGGVGLPDTNPLLFVSSESSSHVVSQEAGTVVSQESAPAFVSQEG